MFHIKEQKGRGTTINFTNTGSGAWEGFPTLKIYHLILCLLASPDHGCFMVQCLEYQQENLQISIADHNNLVISEAHNVHLRLSFPILMLRFTRIPFSFW